MNTRYCLVSDDDCHKYIVPLSKRKLFYELLEQAQDADSYDNFNDEFEDCRANSESSLTFTDPQGWK